MPWPHPRSPQPPRNASLFAITPLAVAEDEVTNIEDFNVIHGVSRDDYVMITNPSGKYKDLKAVQAARNDAPSSSDRPLETARLIRWPTPRTPAARRAASPAAR